MISDLDRLMVDRQIHAMVVYGDTTLANPDLHYVIGAAIARGGIYAKRQGHEPVLVVSNIDLGSARRGRVRDIRTYTDFHYEKLLKSYGRREAGIRLYEKVLDAIGARGKIALYGRNDVSNAISIAESLKRRGRKMIGERSPTLVEEARETKDDWELEKIKEVGRRTSRVISNTVDYLRKLQVKGRIIRYRGKAVTVGEVKKRIRFEMAEENLVAPEDTIFAAGPKGSDPHYEGRENDIIRPGTPIIFDIFPQLDGAYWFDCTRTFVIGNPSRRVRQMYELVDDAVKETFDMLSEGVSCNQPMERVCHFFEKSGFPTPRSLLKGRSKSMEKGFIHSLGHGVGLTIGERPFLTLFDKDPLKKGQVTTVEPGLYDPKVGGVRIEDIALIKGNNCLNLTDVDKFLEL